MESENKTNLNSGNEKIIEKRGNIYYGYSLEDYKELCKDYETKELLKLPKSTVDVQNNLLDNREWWVINDIYYEVPTKKYKKPRGFFALSLPLKVLICSLLLGGVASAIIVPSVMLATNTQAVKERDAIIAEGYDNVVLNKKIEENGDMALTLAINDEKNEITGIEEILIGETKLSPSDYTYDPVNKKILIKKEILDKNKEKIVIKPIVKKIREYFIDKSIEVEIVISKRIDEEGNTICKLVSSDQFSTITGVDSVLIGETPLKPDGNGDYSYDAENKEVKIYKQTLSSYEGDVTIMPKVEATKDTRSPRFKDPTIGYVSNVKFEENGDTTCMLNFYDTKADYTAAKIAINGTQIDDEYFSYNTDTKELCIYKKALNKYSTGDILVEVYNDDPTEVTFEYKEITIYSNDTTAFEIPFIASNSGKITWESEDPTIIQILDENKVQLVEKSVTKDTSIKIKATNTVKTTYECTINVIYIDSEYLDFTQEAYDQDYYSVGAKAGATLPEKIVIPNFYKGQAVVSIKSSGFINQTGIKSVVLPESILAIYPNAFYGTTSLEDINIPKCTRSIGMQAFGDKDKTESYSANLKITFNDFTGVSWTCTKGSESSIQNISGDVTTDTSATIDHSDCSMFKNAKTIDDESDFSYYDLSEKTVAIGPKDSTISGDIEIPSVITVGGITKKVTQLIYKYDAKKGAFYGCSDITSITLPETIEFIGYNVFTECSKLEKIEVDSDNKYYASSDGVLYSKDYLTLLAFPDGKKSGDNYATSFNVPASVKKIDYYAFANNTHLQELNLTSATNLKTIEDMALANMKEIIKIYAPASLETIGMGALYNNSKMTDFTITDTTDNPSKLFSINYGAFSNCTSLTSFTFPSSVRLIAPYAFSKTGLLEAEFKNTSNWTYTGVATDTGKSMTGSMDFVSKGVNASKLRYTESKEEYFGKNWGCCSLTRSGE